MVFFHPNNARWIRGVNVLALLSSGVCSFYFTFMYDFGNHEHIFQPLRRHIHPKIDKYFDITEKDLEKKILDSAHMTTEGAVTIPKSKSSA